tara:strand:- start:272 stop:682 length:411 start_codon:yes stop_codon:yes gene_type:complete
MSPTFTLVTINNYHEAIPGYIKENNITISEYADMTECVLKMIREGYCFNMDKNLLRGFLEDLTYMYSPNDEKNKDRIVNMLEESDDEDSDDSDDDDVGADQMGKMMQMLMGGGMAMAQNNSSEENEGIEEISTQKD